MRKASAFRPIDRQGVEAGAGSGKTAVMAGRIAAMLAEGIAPKSIAAVTFTELAASELLIRVRDFVADLAAGTIPTELRIAFPDGLSANHSANLAAAASVIDEITCSTIHGFCQRLIKPYPVEADIDPGASVMDRNQADLAFIEIVETWLREQLSGGEGGIIAEMVLHNPGETVGLIHKIVANLRKRRTVGEIGRPVMADPSQGLSPDELAGCVVRTLALPEIAELRPTLVPELAVYAAVDVDGVEQATVGIADATSFDNAGRPTVVIDWKSDVQPTAETLNHYRAQVGNYLDMTGAVRGLVVLVTTGDIIAVSPAPVVSCAA